MWQRRRSEASGAAQILIVSSVRWLVRFFYMESLSCSIGSSGVLGERVRNRCEQRAGRVNVNIRREHVCVRVCVCVPLVGKNSHREWGQSIDSICFLAVSSLSSQVGQTHWSAVGLQTLPVLTCNSHIHPGYSNCNLATPHLHVWCFWFQQDYMQKTKKHQNNYNIVCCSLCNCMTVCRERTALALGFWSRTSSDSGSYRTDTTMRQSA